MTRECNGSKSGGALEVVLASVAVVVAVVALVVALTQDTGSNKSTAVTTTTLSAQQLCRAKVASWNRDYEFLEKQRVRLAALVPKLGARLTAELLTHAPNANGTDASHQATLRELSDIQQRMLRLDAHRPQGCA